MLGLRWAYQVGMWKDQVEEALHWAGQTPIKAVEIGGSQLEVYEQHPDKLRAIAQRNQVDIVAVYEFGHFDLWNRRRGLYLFHEQRARLMQQAGIPAVVLGPGLQMVRQRLPEDERRMQQVMSEIIERYSQYGIRTSIHPHWGHCIFREEEIARLMESTDVRVQLVLDTLHTAEGDMSMQSLLDRYCGRVSAIHFKDYSHVDVKDTGLQRQLSSRRTKDEALGQGQGELHKLWGYLCDQGCAIQVVLEPPDASPCPKTAMNNMLIYALRRGWIKEESHEDRH